MGWIKSLVIENTRWEIRADILYTSRTDPFKRYEIHHGPVHKDSGLMRALRSDAAMIHKDNEFIANYDPVLYCNDLTGEIWAFDTKLPSGSWLSNIKRLWAKDGTMVLRADILY